MTEIDKGFVNWLLSNAETHWHDWRGAAFGAFLVYFVSFGIIFALADNTIVRALSPVALSGVFLVVWGVLTRYPQTPKGKVGLIIAIAGSRKAQSETK